MTAQMIFIASANFNAPYGSLTSVQADLLEFARRGLVKRTPIPSVGAGQPEFLYFLARKAARHVPEIGDAPAKSSVFRGYTGEHSLAISSLLAHVERSAGLAGGRVEVLESVRDGSFWTGAGKGQGTARHLIPDHTLLVRIDGRVHLLFVELQRRSAVINPISPQSVKRSFRSKLKRYKAFQEVFLEHPLVQDMVTAHSERPLRGFRVLVVTTRTEASKRNLLASASEYRTLFYFTTMDRVASSNVFLDPIWSVPAGYDRAIADPTTAARRAA